MDSSVGIEQRHRVCFSACIVFEDSKQSQNNKALVSRKEDDGDYGKPSSTRSMFIHFAFSIAMANHPNENDHSVLSPALSGASNRRPRPFVHRPVVKSGVRFMASSGQSGEMRR